MLTFRKTPCRIAIIDEDKDQGIYLEPKVDGEPELDTTEENKRAIFKAYLHRDKKLYLRDLETMMSHYDNPDSALPEQLNRKYTEAGGHLEMSLKRYIKLADHDLMPVVDEASYRLYVTGLSGSGKSYFISLFVKHNRPKHKFVFLFSPVKNDSSLAKIKGLTHLTIEELEKELKREFKVEDLPEGCLVIFDDVESYPKRVAKKYLDLRDQLLERGRHRDISTITVSHNATNGATTKASIRESQYWLLFPKFNARDTKNILKTYGGFSTEEIDQIMHMDSRWVLIKKSVPKYAVGEHEVITY